jgi:BASS family bile acid:Na+ symporter
MDARTLVMLAFQVSILCTVFSYGLRTTVGDLQYLVRRPALLVRSLLAVLVIMPVLAVLLVHLFDIRRTAEIVLVALAISPVPPLLLQREQKGGGRQTYGLALMAVLSLLAIVTVPLTMEGLARFFGRPLGVSPGVVATIVLKMTLLPLAAGLAVHAALPSITDRLDGIVSLIAKVLLPLAVLSLLAGTWRAIWDATGAGAVVAMMVFVVVGLIVGHVMGGPELRNSVVLALSTAVRHPVIALTVASANFPEERFGPSIILYIIINVLVGAVYFGWLRRRRTAVAPA